MSGDINHIVDAAHDPEVSILIASRAVAGEIHAFDLRPILLSITLVVAIDCAQHPGPWTGDDEIPAFVWSDRLAIAGHHIRFNSRKGLGCRARFRRRRAWQRRDHDSTGLSLPPRI